ncbi:MAG: S8 family serine peptidase, partial [Bacteroidales bacterium]
FEKPSLHNIYKLSLPKESNLFETIEALKLDENVVYAEPNYMLSITNDEALSPPMTEAEAREWQSANEPFLFDFPSAPAKAPSPSTTPNDPLYPQQWYIPAVHADAVWDTVAGNDSTQIIAILDTGVDWLHPDLQNKIWINADEIPGNGIDDDGNGKVDDIRGWDWINNDNNPTDDNSHGTHVAGIAAAEANNGIGISGVCQGARIMPLKVFQSSGRGDAATITQGIIYATQNGAFVINMSFGTYVRSFTIEDALINAYAVSVLVAAAGNDGIAIGTTPSLNTAFFPAAYSFVLGTQGSFSSFTNYDQDGPAFSKYYDLWNYEMKAPETNILSTIPNGNYRVYNGTSMAAPVVSGAVCLYHSYKETDSQELLWGNLIYCSSEYINIDSSINAIPLPRLMFVSKTMLDTIGNADKDGMADAGEIIQIWFKIRNTWGNCDSVIVNMGFDEFEDTTTAQFIVSSALIGSTSTYAISTNELNPIMFQIDPSIAHDRDIRFRAMLYYPNSADTIFQNFTINVSNGSELSGILTSDTTLTPDRFWLVNNNLRISTGVTLTVMPGTHLEINAGIDNRGTAVIVGTPDSLIYLKGYFGGNSLYKFVDIDLNNGGFSTNNPIENCSLRKGYTHFYDHKEFPFPSAYNCKFEDFYCYYHRLFGVVNQVIENCLIRNMIITNFASTGYNPNIKKSIFSNIQSFCSGNFPIYLSFESGIFNYTVFNNIVDISPSGKTIFLPASASSGFNSFLSSNDRMYLVQSAGGGDYQEFPNQYWGSNNSEIIRKKYYDFMQNVSLPYLNYEPKLSQPSDSCHAHVWKILVNSTDAQDEYVEPVGVGQQRFDVYFNREMDTTFTPQLTFGVRYPFTQQTVSDSGSWDATHKIWTAYKTIQLYTGDGINRIRVAGAKEVNGWQWEIPIEDLRFEFVIAAAGSASTNFMAQAGIGKVDLEWNNAGIEDLLGFNMYRFMNLTDTTYSDPVLINTSLITDTVYTDFDVIPNEHYWY